METVKLYTEAIEIQVLSAIVTQKAMYALQHHPDLASAGIGWLQYKILTHDELLAAGGFYHDLYMSQFRYDAALPSDDGREPEDVAVVRAD